MKAAETFAAAGGMRPEGDMVVVAWVARSEVDSAAAAEAEPSPSGTAEMVRVEMLVMVEVSVKVAVLVSKALSDESEEVSSAPAEVAT